MSPLKVVPGHGIEPVDIIMAIIALVIILVIPLCGQAVECHYKTDSIGLESKYTVIGGCMIEVEKDMWIPLDNYVFSED